MPLGVGKINVNMRRLKIIIKKTTLYSFPTRFLKRLLRVEVAGASLIRVIKGFNSRTKATAQRIQKAGAIRSVKRTMELAK